MQVDVSVAPGPPTLLVSFWSFSPQAHPARVLRGETFQHIAFKELPMHALTRIPGFSHARRPLLSLLFVFALLAPAQALAECIKTTTRYYFLGIEVWSTETVTCTHGDN